MTHTLKGRHDYTNTDNYQRCSRHMTQTLQLAGKVSSAESHFLNMTSVTGNEETLIFEDVGVEVENINIHISKIIK